MLIFTYGGVVGADEEGEGRILAYHAAVRSEYEASVVIEVTSRKDMPRC